MKSYARESNNPKNPDSFFDPIYLKGSMHKRVAKERNLEKEGSSRKMKFDMTSQLTH